MVTLVTLLTAAGALLIGWTLGKGSADGKLAGIAPPYPLPELPRDESQSWPARRGDPTAETGFASLRDLQARLIASGHPECEVLDRLAPLAGMLLVDDLSHAVRPSHETKPQTAN